MDEEKQTPLDLVGKYQKEIFKGYNSNADYLSRAEAVLRTFKDRHATDPVAMENLEGIKALSPSLVLTIISTMEAVDKVKQLAASDPGLEEEIANICLDGKLKDLIGLPFDIQRLSGKYLQTQGIYLGAAIYSVRDAWNEAELAKKD